MLTVRGSHRHTLAELNIQYSLGKCIDEFCDVMDSLVSDLYGSLLFTQKKKISAPMPQISNEQHLHCNENPVTFRMATFRVSELALI